MSIVRYNPLNIAREIESFLEDDPFAWPSRFIGSDFDLPERFLSSFSDYSPRAVLAHRHDPAVNIYETDKEWIYMVELPGVKESDIKLECDGGYLRMSAERKFESSEEGKGYHVRELCEGKFERYFKLHDGSYIEGIKGTLKDGILKIMVPKGEKAKSKLIDITAE